jgi:Zn-dependent alcohol dehydrogenase
VKAAVCWEAGKPLVVEDVVLDPPKGGEVRVRIGAVAIRHSDVHLVRGDWAGWTSTPPPVVAGHEAAGVVVDVAAGVTRVAPGDRVVVSLLRTCGGCIPCLSGAAYLCEGSFALMTEHRLHSRTGQPINAGIRVAGFAEAVVVDQSQLDVIVHTLTPLTPDRSRVTCDWLFAPDAVAEPGFDPADTVAVFDRVNRQDWEVCEWVQAGVRSRAFAAGGVYVPIERHIRGFNDFVLEQLGLSVEASPAGPPRPSA